MGDGDGESNFIMGNAADWSCFGSCVKVTCDIMQVEAHVSVGLTPCGSLFQHATYS